MLEHKFKTRFFKRAVYKTKLKGLLLWGKEKNQKKKTSLGSNFEQHYHSVQKRKTWYEHRKKQWPSIYLKNKEDMIIILLKKI